MSAACLWWLVSWWPADSCVGIVESRLQCPTIHHYTVTATVLGCCFLSAGSLATGQDTHNRSGKVITTQTFATCRLLLTGKWIIMTDIRQQRQVLRKCGGGSRGSVRKESEGMETRKSETHAACCNNMQYIT